jgi:hypothetical protein
MPSVCSSPSSVYIVVHREQRAVDAEREELDRIVVHAGLQRLLGGAIARVPSEGSPASPSLSIVLRSLLTWASCGRRMTRRLPPGNYRHVTSSGSGSQFGAHMRKNELRP